MADLLVGVSAIVVAVVAWLGLHTWRKQLTGKAEYDLARRLLRATYKLRDAIREARIPGMHRGEIDAGLREAGQDVDSEKLTDEQSSKGAEEAWRLRWRGVWSAASDLAVENLEAEVLWGDSAQKVSEPLRACVQHFYMELQAFLAYMFPSDPRFAAGFTNQQKRATSRVVFYQGKDDAFEKGVLDAVKKVEGFVRPHLGTKRVSRGRCALCAKWIKRRWCTLRAKLSRRA